MHFRIQSDEQRGVIILREAQKVRPTWSKEKTKLGGSAQKEDDADFISITLPVRAT